MVLFQYLVKNYGVDEDLSSKLSDLDMYEIIGVTSNIKKFSHVTIINFRVQEIFTEEHLCSEKRQKYVICHRVKSQTAL